MQSLVGIEGEVDRDDVWLIEARARQPSKLGSAQHLAALVPRQFVDHHRTERMRAAVTRLVQYTAAGDFTLTGSGCQLNARRASWRVAHAAAGKSSDPQQSGGSGGGERRPCADQRAHLEGRQRRARAHCRRGEEQRHREA